MEDNPWTDTLVAKLRLLVAEQIPYSQIARQLKVSRNAVIGKARRLKINPAGEVAAADDRPAKPDPRHGQVAISTQPCQLPVVEDRPSAPRRAFDCEPTPPTASCDPLNLRIDQLRFFHCRYITNDDVRHATYCGRDTVGSTSWCAFHLAKVRAPLPDDDIPLVPSLVGPTQSKA